MTDETKANTAKPPKTEKAVESREDRLGAALRANLKRRKAQARSRKSDVPSDGENSGNADDSS